MLAVLATALNRALANYLTVYKEGAGRAKLKLPGCYSATSSLTDSKAIVS